MASRHYNRDRPCSSNRTSSNSWEEYSGLPSVRVRRLAVRLPRICSLTLLMRRGKMEGKISVRSSIHQEATFIGSTQNRVATARDRALPPNSLSRVAMGRWMPAGSPTLVCSNSHHRCHTRRRCQQATWHLRRAGPAERVNLATNRIVRTEMTTSFVTAPSLTRKSS